MITVNDVSMNYGPQTLFEGVNVTFNQGSRYGLTGPNGSGKTTFMRILSGDLEPTSGTIYRPKKFGLLRQDHHVFDAFKVLDVVLMGNPHLWAALSEKEELLAKGDELSDEQGVRLGELEVTISEEDGYTAEGEASELLLGLGVPEQAHQEPLSTLQGGDKVRVLLAQALFGKPEALLLDEPTNTLDIGSIRWLESFLVQYQGALVVISHDRHFLNAVCDRIADIDYQAIIVYTGHYDDMVSTKAEARGSLELANEARQKKVSQLQEFVQRFRAGSRASQVKSREKQLEREKQALADLKRSNIQRPFIRFPLDQRGGKQILTVENLGKRLGDTQICKGFNLSVFRGEKIAVVGPNGIGKTSLLRLLKQEIEPDSGKVEWGYEAKVGYMPQDHGELIEKSDQSAHQWLWSWNPKTDEESLRALFGRLLFTKDQPLKPTRVLSGGETVRLLLARLMLMQPNVLLLDEPTNHLDLEAIRSLTEALGQYQGTCLFVTHDRQMVTQVATRILELSKSGICELTPGQFHEGGFLVSHTEYKRAAAW